MLQRGRAQTESRMKSSAVVVRKTGTEVDDYGREVPSLKQIYPNPDWPEDHPHADGKCYFRYPGLAFASVFDSAGVTVTQSRLVGRFPFGVEFAVGDVVTIMSDPDNPNLAGTELTVSSIDDQSQATAQRLLLDDNQKGVEDDD
ncbi:MAG TPA: DUF6093 family protein [Enteractinococcus sp.]